MVAWKSAFTTHPASVNETYAQHFASALGFGLSMLAAAGACLVHAVFPFLFVRTGSETIARLYDRMITHRARVAPPSGSQAQAAE